MNSEALSCSLGCVLALSLAACGGGGGGALVGARVDSNGGTLAVTDGPLAGARLVVPPGALAAPVDLSIAEASAAIPRLAQPLFVVVGPAVRFQPAGTTFAKTAEATVPFDPALVPPRATPESFVALSIDETDPQSESEVLEVLGLDEFQGRATFLLRSTTTCVAAVRIGQPTIPFPDYLPLSSGSSFEYDDASFVLIEDTAGVPNLTGVPLTRITFEQGFRQFGFYWRRNGIGQTLWLGRFSTNPEFQEIAITPGVVFPQSFVPGQPHLSFFEWEWYPRIREGNPANFGSTDLDVRIASPQSPLDVPLGTFTDVLEVEVRADFGQGVVLQIYRLWLARGVGVVQYEIDGVRAGLVSGVIDGRPVVPR